MMASDIRIVFAHDSPYNKFSFTWKLQFFNFFKNNGQRGEYTTEKRTRI
jgi:hypothetical protein